MNGNDLPRACMGGWCELRDRCGFYHNTRMPESMTSQRLCFAGDDGIYSFGAPNGRRVLYAAPIHDLVVRQRLQAEVAAGW